MDITKKELKKRYSAFSDGKIIELYQSEELTDIAYSVLRTEVLRRGLSDDKIQDLGKKKAKISESPQSENKQKDPEKRPANVKRALLIMWVKWGLVSLFVAVFVFGETVRAIEVNIAVSLGFTYLSVIVLFALLIRAVSRGKNWARFTYAVFASIGILFGFANILSPGTSVPIWIHSLLVVAANSLVILLLFQRESTDWFRQISKENDKFKSLNSNSDFSNGESPEPKKLRYFIIIVLALYFFLTFPLVLSFYFSIEGTKDIVLAIKDTFVQVFLILTLFTFVKRNRLCLLFALIMSIGGYFFTLIWRLYFITGGTLESTDFANIVLYALPSLLIFLYRQKSLPRTKR